jgi:hypothetical protein
MSSLLGTLPGKIVCPRVRMHALRVWYTELAKFQLISTGNPISSSRSPWLLADKRNYMAKP